jgi:ligand-binding sensor domain-containing protein
LPEPTIYSILQDHRGYLWLGTQSGLVRFDGVRFTVIEDPTLRNAWIQSLAEDRQHDLWVGTKGRGLVRLRDDQVARTPAARTLGPAVETLLVDRSGALWVAIDNGSRVAKVANGRADVYAKGLLTTAIAAGCQADDGTIWLGGKGSSLSIWNGAGFARYPLAPALLARPDRCNLPGFSSLW